LRVFINYLDRTPAFSIAFYDDGVCHSRGHTRPFLYFSSACVFHLLYNVVTVVGADEKPSGSKGTG